MAQSEANQEKLWSFLQQQVIPKSYLHHQAIFAAGSDVKKAFGQDPGSVTVHQVSVYSQCFHQAQISASVLHQLRQLLLIDCRMILNGLCVPAEVEWGNVEYKLQLIDPTPDRFQQLVTQMKWRLQEGHGEACYLLGVSDAGELLGLHPTELQTSLHLLSEMARQLGTHINPLVAWQVSPSLRTKWMQRRRMREERSWRTENSEEMQLMMILMDHYGDPQTIQHERSDDLFVVECWIRTRAAADVTLMSLLQDPQSQGASKESSEGGTPLPSPHSPSSLGPASPLVPPVHTHDVGLPPLPPFHHSSGSTRQQDELRIFFLGSTSAGKSTLMSVLAYQELDTGRGRARVHFLKHPHELRTGRSSGIVHWSCLESDLVRFWKSKVPVDPSATHASLSDESRNNAPSQSVHDDRRWMLIDSCGHNKYLNTTLHAMAGYDPDLACLVVDGLVGQMDSMTKELIGCALVLKIPFIVLVTKIDILQSGSQSGVSNGHDIGTTRLQTTLESLLRLLGPAQSEGRTPVVIQSMDDAKNAAEKFHCSTEDDTKEATIPIFLVSSVTGEALPFLVEFLRNVHSRPLDSYSTRQNSTNPDEVEFLVEDVYSVPEVGSVVGGRLLKGSLQLFDSQHELFIGPFAPSLTNNPSNGELSPSAGSDGVFMNILITSMHRQRRPVSSLMAVESGALAIQFTSSSTQWNAPRLRKGMVIVTKSSALSPKVFAQQNLSHGAACWEFEADMLILYIPSHDSLEFTPEDTSDHESSRHHLLPQLQSSSLQSSGGGQGRKRRNSSYSRQQPSPQLLSASSPGHLWSAPAPTISSPLSSPQSPPHTGHYRIGRVFCGMVQQTCQIMAIRPIVSPDTDTPQIQLKSGMSARIRFRFTRNPEYLHSGQVLLFREKQQPGGRSPSESTVGRSSTSPARSISSKGISKMVGRVL